MKKFNDMPEEQKDPVPNDAIETLMDSMKATHNLRVAQVEDSTTVSRTTAQIGVFFDIEELKAMAKKSPTAQRYILASKCFEKAWELFEGADVAEPYQSIEGVYSFVEGMYHENVMAVTFPWNFTAMLDFLEKHISKEPQDYAARYAQFRIHWTDTRISDEDKIREVEILINDIEVDAEFANILLAENDLLRKVYHVSCFHVASMYTSTDQSQRAIDMFQKCLDIDPNNYISMLGIGANKSVLAREDCSLDPKTKEPKYSEKGSKLSHEALEMFEKYLSNAPACDKKYPEALYELASAYLQEGQVKKYLNYYERALDAEEKPLPYDRSVQIGCKNLTKGMYKLMRPRVCYNTSCTEAVGVPLKRCTDCLEALYCGKQCQKEHRRVHKKKCKIAKKARTAAGSGGAVEGHDRPGTSHSHHAGCCHNH